jgi:hypothetical protein
MFLFCSQVKRLLLPPTTDEITWLIRAIRPALHAKKKPRREYAPGFFDPPFETGEISASDQYLEMPGPPNL